MSTGPANDVDELWQRYELAGSLPHGPGRIRAIESLVRATESVPDRELRFAVRLGSVQAYIWGGEPARAFSPFAWCLAAHDRGEAPQRMTHTLLWCYKSIINQLGGFPEVPLHQVRSALGDMERRYRLGGHTMNPVHQHGEGVERHVGDRMAAAERFRLWQAAPRGDLSDCRGCEPDDVVNHLVWSGRYEEAVTTGEEAMASDLNCISQPHGLLTNLVVPYLHTGRLQEAARAHRQAYRKLRTLHGKMHQIGQHILFCALSDNAARGVEILERHLPELATPPSPMAELVFSAAAAAVLGQVGALDAVRYDGREVPAAELRAELTDRARALASAFDTRNGTTEQSRQAEQMLAAQPLLDRPLPLSPSRSTASVVPLAPVPAADPPPADRSAADPPAATAAELADLARELWARGDREALAPVWDRFDAVCPDPQGRLLAQRLDFAAVTAVESGELDRAEELFRRSADIYRTEGAGADAGHVLGRLAWLLSETDRHDAATALARELVAGADARGDVDDSGLARAGLVRVLVRSGAGRLGEAAEEAAAALATRPADDVAGSLHEALMQMWLADPRDVDAALVEADRATEHLRAAGASTRLQDVRLTIGAALVAAGDPAVAYAVLRDIDPPLEDEARQARRARMLGHLGLRLGREDEARSHLLGAVTALTALGLPEGAARAKVDLAAACLRTGHLDDAADAAEEAVDELAGIDEAAMIRARFLLAEVCDAQGEPDMALTHYADVAQACVTSGNRFGAGRTEVAAASILDRLDRDAEAAVRYAAAAAHFAEAGWPFDAAEHRRRAALSWHWAGDHDEAMAALAVADGAAAQLEGPDGDAATVWHRAMVAYDGARVLSDWERVDEALVRLAPAASAFRSIGELDAAAAAATLYGKLLLAADRPGEARTALEAALADLPADATERREQITALLP